MITKNDCLNSLFQLKENGIDCTKQIKALVKLQQPTIDIIKFINEHQELNVRKFYEKLRHSYNNKKSKLYKNIVDVNSLSPKDVLCCLGSLQLQILLFDKTLNNDIAFLHNARFDEISKVLLNYYNTHDIIPCQKLLSMFKSDLKILEEISK